MVQQSSTRNPNPAFRPNPRRGVFLSQPIDQQVLNRLVPTILSLQAESREPISLYIDSPGGGTLSANSLQAVLRAGDQDGNAPCRLITIATGTAASAAGDLLMAGEYALALPHAQILCHGVQSRGQEALTREAAYQLSLELANSNERFAILLASNCVGRFMFRVAAASAEFPAIRERLDNPVLSHAACLIEYGRTRVSSSLVSVLESALERSIDNDALDFSVSQTLIGVDVGAMPRLQFEVHVLKAILDYEAQQHSADPSWGFGKRGLQMVQGKLELLLDKYGDHHAEMLASICARWGRMFLSADQSTEISQLPEDDRQQRIEAAVRGILSPLWFFFVSICRVLQLDDYWMSAEEAYWLGLIDELIGRTDLPCPRVFLEYPPADPDQQAVSAPTT